MIELPESLAEFSVQEIQFELMRRAMGDGYNAREIISLLNQQQDLWKAVLIDRLFVVSHKATSLIYLPLLYQLRDLPDNQWNTDQLYVLTPKREDAEKLAELGASRGLWDLQHSVTLYDEDESARMLPYYKQKSCIFSVWWD